MSHQSTVTATMPTQCKHTECTVPKHCSGYWCFLYIRKKVQTEDRRRRVKKKNSVATVATVPLEQTKRMEAFTYSPNKCYNIFTKHLFSIVFGHSFIFYYFILTYKKLTPQ